MTLSRGVPASHRGRGGRATHRRRARQAAREVLGPARLDHRGRGEV